MADILQDFPIHVTPARVFEAILDFGPGYACHCWALYLRVLRRYLEYGETVPYDQRLDV